MENLELLVKELIKNPNETEWLEFKTSNYNPDMIGQDISALANSAALVDKETAYMIWGVSDEKHEIIGTDYNQFSKLEKNQEIENSIRRYLSENADFAFKTIEIEGKSIVILTIHRALNRPVTFKKIDYIRVGSYTKKLMDCPNLQTSLWDKIRLKNFEMLNAKIDLTVDDALNLIDYPLYYSLMQRPIPANRDAVFHDMLEEEIIKKQDNGLYAITNMGAILFAKNISQFPSVQRKAIRVVKYNGNNKLEILNEYTGAKGYVVGFEGLMSFLDGILPSSEPIEGAVRKKKNIFPVVALREIIANALIHQDFTVTGTGPIIEIFDTRIEVTNPGRSLVDINRIVDNPPKSRNEKLASLMRRLRMCEELGSGWDRIVLDCEKNKMPIPKIQLYEENTKIIVFSERPFSKYSQEEKLWACYMHACVKYVIGETASNSSLRERFNLPQSSAGYVSRIIKAAVEKGLLKQLDSTVSQKMMSYIPAWG